MKDLGWRRWSVALAAVVGVLLLQGINRPLNETSAYALVGIVLSYCVPDAATKINAFINARAGSAGQSEGAKP